MSFTVNNVIEDVRPLVADSTAPYMWPDVVIKSRINEALAEIFSRRPDAMITASSSAPDALLSMYDEIPVESRFKTAINFFTASRLLAERSSDKSLRTQGMDYLKMFNSLMDS